jgi:hypothetical protein
MKEFNVYTYSLWFFLALIFIVACTETNVGDDTSDLPHTEAVPVTTIQPTLPIPRLRLDEMERGQSLKYRNIIPGVSSKQDVINEWGEPNVIRTYESYKSLHYFYTGQMEYVLIKDEIVHTITTSVRELIVYKGRSAQMQDLSELLHIPEVITYPFGTPTQVFPGFGLAVSGFPSNIQAYQFFAPSNFQEYQNLWGNYPIKYDPFPLIASVDEVGIKPGTTTREQLSLLLGNPDRIVFEDPNDPWLYDLEPDLLGRLRVSFNDNDTVQYMGTDGGTKGILLEEIINSFGTPDVIQLLPDEHGSKYGYGSLGLVYLERGLRVATNCVTETCAIVKRDERVNQKWYFQPTSLEAFQQIVPESDFIDWQGFQD